MTRRRWYVNDGLTEEGALRYQTAVAMRVCPFHGMRLPPRHRVWCGRGGQTTGGAVSCYWLFAAKYTRIRDWKTTRAQALERDGGRCVNCGAKATEVDHVVEIQDGGSEFDLENTRSLCHDCHVVKTVARRRYGPGRVPEGALVDRVRRLHYPIEAFTTEGDR